MFDNFMKRLKLAPLLFLCNSFWMLGNPQMFGFGENQYTLIGHSSEAMKSGHFLDYKILSTHATPIFLICIMNFALIILQYTIPEKLQAWGFDFFEKEIEIDEDLPQFHHALSIHQADEIIEEYEKMK